jgi:iron complex transport system ATP-binding protein
MIRLHTKEATITQGRITICCELNLSVKTGQTWGILGANGSGKTTLLHTLAGLHPVQQGEIWLNEKKIKNLSPRTIAQSIAILFQDFTDTFPQTVWDYCKAARFPHLAYFKKASRHDWDVVTEALQAVDLYSLATRSITHLSGGEKRRLALASVLSQTPHIYLLDEPTNHLDVRHQIDVLSHFQRLVTNQSAAVVMSLHDVNLAQLFCTHILLLYPDGQTIQGCTQEILTTANLSSLYQHEITPIHSPNGMYWQPKSGITKTI